MDQNYQQKLQMTEKTLANIVSKYNFNIINNKAQFIGILNDYLNSDKRSLFILKEIITTFNSFNNKNEYTRILNHIYTYKGIDKRILNDYITIFFTSMNQKTLIPQNNSNSNKSNNYSNNSIQPKDKYELKEIIEDMIKKNGYYCNLNIIDVSKIKDFSFLFYNSVELNNFRGDISNWDVSNVTIMKSMFKSSEFNGDISNWDVSNVIDMNRMFFSSKFNQNIFNWNITNVRDMENMFAYSVFNKDISNWDVSKVEDMNDMFYASKFKQNISKWNVSKKN